MSLFNRANNLIFFMQVNEIETNFHVHSEMIEGKMCLD